MNKIVKSNNVIYSEWNEKYQTDCFEEINYYLVDDNDDIQDELFSFQYYVKIEEVDGEPAWKAKQTYIAIDEILEYDEYEETERDEIELNDFLDEIELLKEQFENIESHIDMDSINKLLN